MYNFLIITSLLVLLSSCTRSLSDKNYRRLQGVWYMADGSDFIKIVKGSVDNLVPYGRFKISLKGDTIHYKPIDEDNKIVPEFDEIIIKLTKKELITKGLQSGERLHWLKKKPLSNS